MWEKIKEHFRAFPAQQTVALAMLRQGLRVSEKGKIYCGDIEISSAKMARALHVDRRVVTATAKTIISTPYLFEIFRHLRPFTDLSKVAKVLGYAVIEIEAEGTKPGILADVTKILAEKGIVIRQVVAEDPELVPNPRFLIIVQDHIGPLVDNLLRTKGVTKVTLG